MSDARRLIGLERLGQALFWVGLLMAVFSGLCTCGVVAVWGASQAREPALLVGFLAGAGLAFYGRWLVRWAAREREASDHG